MKNQDNKPILNRLVDISSGLPLDELMSVVQAASDIRRNFIVNRIQNMPNYKVDKVFEFIEKIEQNNN